jgi:hypothetical protein
MFTDKRHKRRIAMWMLLFVTEIIVPVTAMAQSQSDSEFDFISPLGSIGIGRAVVSFDTKVTLIDKTGGDDIFIDPEGNLKLPRISRVNVFYANFNITRKHHLGLAYFGANRESKIFDTQANLGDLLIISGTASISEKSEFYFLNYGYSMYLDNRSSIDGLIGIAGLDLHDTFDANGQLALKGVTLLDRTYHRDASIFAPLPLLGLKFNFAYTPKWIFGGKAAFVAGTYEDTRAYVTQAQMNMNYWFTKHWGAVVGFTYFNARAVIEDDMKKQEIDYGYTGVYAGLHFAF